MFASDTIQLLHPPQDIRNIHVGIVYTQWNARLTEMMYYDAVQTLKSFGIVEDNIHSVQVPGAVEIPFVAKKLAEKTTPSLAGVLTLGCIIQGDTSHFEYVAMSVTQGITQLNIQYSIPFIFGVLTTNNYQQAIERAGIKGKEYAVSLLNMIGIHQRLQEQGEKDS